MSEANSANLAPESALPVASSKELDTSSVSAHAEPDGSSVDGCSSARPWDFSNRRIVVQGVLKHDSQQTVEIMIGQWIKDFNMDRPAQQHLGFQKIRKPPGASWMSVVMDDESMVQPFIDFVNSSNFESRRGVRIHAKLEGSKRSRSDGGDNSRDCKRQRKHMDGEEARSARRPISEDELRDKVTPLWRQTPLEQTETKMKTMIKKCAIKISHELKTVFRKLNTDKNRKKVNPYPWILQRGGVFVEDMVTVPSPVRNKCEVTFGYRYLEASDYTTEEEPPKVSAVGFMVTGWSGGVAFSNNLPHISPEASAIIKIVNDEFLPNTPLPPYDPKTHTGFWRILTIRTSQRTKENMVIIQHSPMTGGQGDMTVDYSKDFETEKARLISMLTSADLCPDGSHGRVTSIFFQEFDGLSHPPPEHPVQHAYGKEFLTEQLGQCRFQISPGAFFQVNTQGAELLYEIAVKKVKEVVEDPDKTLLFDVCCGTGTIGLTCLKEGVVGRVVGVDISEPAIRDAKQNAILNGFGTQPKDDAEAQSKTQATQPEDDAEAQSRTRYVSARAEHVLGKEIYRAKTLTTMKFVALVDPARDGLHADVIRSIRANERIDRLVYVSCNPTGSLVRDATALCGPPTKRMKGRAFKVVSATPVDIFPLTDHCEMVMVFDRLTDNQLKDEDSQGDTKQESAQH